MIDAIFAVIENDIQRNELSEFYHQNKDCLYRIAFSKLQNKADAEDAVHESFARIVTNPKCFFDIPPQERINYMIIVVRNASIDIFNKKNKIPLEEFDENDFYNGNPLSLEDEMIGNVARDELKSFIKTLPSLQRDVLMMRCVMGLSVNDTAESLNISESAVKVRLHLARKAVREFLEKENLYE